ncbi:MAG: F0F1 ATP synthase subunit delta [Cyanobacteria bacterium REEB67]|nr:F0F1 ATP synthase subunit delta [Cyanobacteria bacterium REEB67]
MLIDWFTVAAQIINFLILVWLMKAFLYKPILKAIDSREKLVADDLKNAASSQEQAKKTQTEFDEKTKTFEAQKDALLQKATEAAKSEGQRLAALAEQEAKLEAKKEQTKLATDLAKEQRDFCQAVALKTQQQVFAITRKLLTELTTSNLEAEAIDVFSRRLLALADGPKNDLTMAMQKASAGEILVQSAFDLPQKQQADLQKTIETTFKTNLPLSFTTAPELVSGIKLTVNGQSLEWSINGYLTALEDSLEKTATDSLENTIKKPSSHDDDKETQK